MSRRRTEWGPIDHGASFFQARHPLFQKQVDAWLQQGLVFSWSRGFQMKAVTGVNLGSHAMHAVKV